MGFGTLFFGYFLILNVFFYEFTDVISGLVTAYALYKLSSVNKPFKGAFYTALLFSAIGAFELVTVAVDMFNPNSGLGELANYTYMFRCAVIAVITLLILLGIESVADEVGLHELAKKARYSMPPSLIAYLLLSVCSIQDLPVGEAVLRWLYTLSLLFVFIITLINLFTIYGAYMKICMPEDKDNNPSDEPSRFEFINKYREHKLEREREYIEYKLQKKKKKNSNKKKK